VDAISPRTIAFAPIKIPSAAMILPSIMLLAPAVKAADEHISPTKVVPATTLVISAHCELTEIIRYIRTIIVFSISII